MNVVKDLIGVNITKGRKSPHPLDVLVIHVMEGHMAGTRSWFNSKVAAASAHYGISRLGEIVQYVEETDTAWHAGRVNKPIAPIIIERQPSNPNAFSIGIEHEGTGKSELTAAQKAASVWLIRDICLRRKIPIDRRHIVGHREIYALKSCPGKIDVDALVQVAQVEPEVPPFVAPRPLVIQSNPPRVVWSNSANDWLVVTRYEADDNWRFVTLKSLAALGTRAQTPLSQMPLKQP